MNKILFLVFIKKLTIQVIRASVTIQSENLIFLKIILSFIN